MATRNHSNNKAYALWQCLMSASLSSITNTGQNDFITRSPLWSNMVKYNTQSSTDRFRKDFCGDCSMKVATTAHITIQDIGRLLRGESFIFLYINTLFPTLKELPCTDMASKLLLKRCHHLICAVFMHPNTCYQTILNWLTAHNCHSHLYTTHY